MKSIFETIKKTGFIFALTITISGCGTLPKEDNYSIPLEHFGPHLSNSEMESFEYKLQPEDILDVIFRFNTISEEIYRIQAHDKLNITFLTASEYDGVYQVRPDGYISLPFIEGVKVAGLSVQEIISEFEVLYKSVLKDPSFFVSLAEYQVHLKDIRASLDHPNTGQSRLVTVRQDGRITLPMIGDLSAKGRSVVGLRAEANVLYRNVVKGMSVDILLKKSHPRQIYVFGEVNKPGAHQIIGPISLFHAVAIAGGASKNAELTTVVTMTQVEGEMVAKVFNLENALMGDGEVLSAMLSPEDVVYVPKTSISTTAQVMRYVSDILLFRGIGINITN